MFSSDDISNFSYEIFFEKEALEKKPLEELLGKLTLSSLKMKRFSGISVFLEGLGEMIPTVEFRERDTGEGYYTGLRVFENKMVFHLGKPEKRLVVGTKAEAKEPRKPFSEDSLREFSQDLDFVVGVLVGFTHGDRPLKSQVEMTVSRKSEPLILDHLYKDVYLSKVKGFAVNPRLIGLHLNCEETLLGLKTSSEWEIYHEEGKTKVRVTSKMEGVTAVNLAEIIRDRIDRINRLFEISSGE